MAKVKHTSSIEQEIKIKPTLLKASDTNFCDVFSNPRETGALLIMLEYVSLYPFTYFKRRDSFLVFVKSLLKTNIKLTSFYAQFLEYIFKKYGFHQTTPQLKTFQ